MCRAVSFFASSAAGAAVIAGAPLVVAAKKTDSETIIGEGEHEYRVTHAWPQLPDKYSWQTTHNVAVDSAENLYVIHEGHADKTDHPSIFAFDKDGKFIRAFGNQYQGGGHGIEVRQEGSEEFLYVCAYQQVKEFSKLTLDGEIVWTKRAPMESEVYHEDEAKNPAKVWGRDRFMPTNFAFLDDGGFLLADGYGSFYIHRYDKDGNWVSKFGGPGNGEGTFATPHGIWIDRRPGKDPQIVVCDRAHHTLQTFTMDGKYLKTIEGYGLPRQPRHVAEPDARPRTEGPASRCSTRTTKWPPGSAPTSISSALKTARTCAADPTPGVTASSSIRTMPASTHTATSSSPNGSPLGG